MVKRQLSYKYIFIVPGRAYSAQARSRLAYQHKVQVRQKAEQFIPKPLIDNNLFIRIDYFYKSGHKVDGDNLAKPICDALEGVAYNDDGQITDHRVVVYNIDTSYTIDIDESILPDIYDYLADDEEFIVVSVGMKEIVRQTISVRRAKNG